MADCDPQNSAGAGICACLGSPHAQRTVVLGLGMDAHYREAAILVCLTCGQLWLRLHEENEAFTGSGRWYLGAITAEQASRLSAETSQATLEALDWYFYGGSYYDGQTGIVSGTIW